MTIGDLLVRLGVDATELNRGFSRSEKIIERLGTQLFFLGSRVTAGFSVPMLAGIGVITKFGLEFDKAMTESLAIMDNVTPQIRAQMEGVAMDVARTTKFSAKEAAEGYFSLASAGLDAATSMGALPIAARFAQAGVFDLAKSTDYLASAQAAMGAATDSASQKIADMARIADVLTQANNMALGTVQDFAEGLTNRAGQMLRLFNKDVEEGAAVLAAYASMNIKGKNAGQQLYMMIRDLARSNIANRKEWERHNIAVFDAAGNMRNLADILGDFERAMAGATDEQKRQILMQLGMQDRSLAATQALIGFSGQIRIYEDALRDAAGVTQQVADKQMEALSNQIMRLYHEAQIMAVELFNAFVPTIRQEIMPALESLLDVGKGVAGFIADLPEPFKVAALAIAGIGIAIGPVTVALGSFMLLASSAMRGVTLLTGVLGPLGKTLAVAAGAQLTYNQVVGASAIAQTAAANALGTTVKAAAPLVLTQTQLTAALRQTYTAAVAGAVAMGNNAVKAHEAGVAAQVLLANQQRLARGQAAVNAAMAAGATRVTLLSRALTLVLNPFIAIPAVVIAAAGAIYLYNKRQEEMRRQFVENIDEFDNQTNALKTNLRALMELKDAEVMTVEEAGRLNRATRELAEASGMSEDAFQRETDSSDRLIESFNRQLRAREELKNGMIRMTREQVIEAERALGVVKQELDQAMMGRVAGVVMPTTFGGISAQGPQQMELGSPMHVERVMELQERVKELGDTAEEARKQLRRLMGEEEPGMTIRGAQFELDPQLEVMRDREIATLRNRMKEEGKTTAQIAEAVAEVNRQWQNIIEVGKTPPGVDVGDLDDRNTALKRFQDQVTEMKATLMGTGGKDLEVLRTAWSELMASTKGAVAENVPAIGRLVDKYREMRQEFGLVIPEFDALMQKQQMAAIQSGEFEAGFKDLGEAITGVEDRLNATSKMWGFWQDEGVNEFLNNAEKINIALGQMGKQDVDQFFEDNARTLDDLTKRYGDLPPAVRQIVMAYLEWKKTSEDTINANIKDIKEVKGAISDFLGDTIAKLEDSRQNLAIFTEDYADRELVSMKKGLATQRNEHRKHTQKLIQDLAGRAHLMNREEFLSELERINTARRAGEERLEIEERIGTLRLLETAGVHDRLIRDSERYETVELQGIYRRARAHQQFFEDLQDGIEQIRLLGELSGLLGFEEFAETMQGMAQGLGTFAEGIQAATQEGASVTEQINGWITAGMGAIQMFQALADEGSRAVRTLSAAITGAQIGAQLGGGWGALIGAGIGALVGLFSGDPAWKEIQDEVNEKIGTLISEDTAKLIEADVRRLGSRLKAELANLPAIIEDAGGLTAANFRKFADFLATGFAEIDRRTANQRISSEAEMIAQAGALDNVFADLADAATTTNGILASQVVELIRLDRAYGTASKAVREFVQDQLGMVAEGFNKVVAGTYAPFADLFSGAEGDRSEMDALIDKIERYRAVLKDFEDKPPTNAKQRAQQQITIRQLEAAEKKLAALERKAQAGERALEQMFAQREESANMGKEIDKLTEKAEDLTERIADAKAKGEDPTKFEMDLSEVLRQIDELSVKRMELEAQTQGQFDRMGRLAAATFGAMLASGMPLFQALEAIGPGLDNLMSARDLLGFTPDESLGELFVFREFAEQHPMIVEMLDGLNQMLSGLHNTAFMTDELFTDLGATAVDVFNDMVQGGLTSDQAMRLMQPTLQRLWEMQKAFGYAVDETTQLLIDQAVEAGVVGEEFMSAQDKMVLGLDRVALLLETLIEGLGIALPRAAEEGAQGVNDALGGIRDPDVTIRWKYARQGGDDGPPSEDVVPFDPQLPQYGTGAHLESGPHLAVVGDTNEWIIRDPDFQSIMHDAVQAGVDAASANLDTQAARSSGQHGGNMIVYVQMDGRNVARAAFPYTPDEARRFRLVP